MLYEVIMLDVAIDDHVGAHEAHCAHANAVAKLVQLVLELGDLRVGIAGADDPQVRTRSYNFV